MGKFGSPGLDPEAIRATPIQYRFNSAALIEVLGEHLRATA